VSVLLASSLSNFTAYSANAVSEGSVVALAALGFLLPALAVGARRLHDIGKSGWLQLLMIIPIVNLVLIYFYVQPSQPESNPHGVPAT